MWIKPLLILLTLQSQTLAELKKGWAIVGAPLLHANPCPNNTDVLLSFEPGLPPGTENQYHINIDEEFPHQSKIVLKFDTEATVTLRDNSTARVSVVQDEFHIKFFKFSKGLNFKVQGRENGPFPYITSMVINTVESCLEPKTGFLDSYVIGEQDTAEVSLSTPDQSCGRRKVQYTELITNGLPTKPGDWPWHTAIYRLQQSSINYICGGTLMSKNFVLTAAHCVTIKGVRVLPEIISVVLGKYNLIGGDIATQEREIHEIIVHEEFDNKLNNDIALLKLKTEVVYNDYVQPACLWYSDAYKKLPPGDIHGTVVGWGFDHTDTLSSQLKQAYIPKISDLKCIKSNPVFFGQMLTNNRKFCAGWNNGTSACNGDSGGGFLVFVPDKAQDTSSAGAWYVRGIVSLSVARRDIALCDSSQYVIFTDVAKYKGWVNKFIKG